MGTAVTLPILFLQFSLIGILATCFQKGNKSPFIFSLGKILEFLLIQKVNSFEPSSRCFRGIVTCHKWIEFI